MKSMILSGLRRIEMTTKPVPELQRTDEVLVRMKSVGVCGSDIHYFLNGRIGSQVVKYPFTIGHEGAGIVERTASGVTMVKPGDRVAIDPAMACYDCDQCNNGRYHTCRKLKFLGCPGQAEGCLSEYIVVPASSCYPLPENLSMDQGALSEPLSIGLYAVRSAGAIVGKTIAILGAGPIGISVMLSAMAKGAGRIYITDKIDDRLAIARSMGAGWVGNVNERDIVKDILEETPQQPDIVFECCGSQEAADQAVEMLKPGGRLMIIGIPSFERWSFDVDNMRRKEITVQNVRRQNECVSETLEMISNGRIKPDLMKTHTFTLDKTPEAFDLVARYGDGVVKAMIHL
jgi:L-iditol 2-dehydrogenase